VFTKPTTGSLHDYVSELTSERRAQKEKVQLDMGIEESGDNAVIADPIEFAESKWGLDQPLWPTQRAVLKCFYGMPLDDTVANIPIREYPHETILDNLTEKGFVEYMTDNGRSNVNPDKPHDSTQLILVMGRRSGKTFMSALILCYTLYQMIKMGDPQEFYGLPSGELIKVANVAATKDQATVLFNMVSNFINKSPFFKRYHIKTLETKIKIATPADLQKKKLRPSLEVRAYPCSAKSIRGSGTITAVMDEIAHYDSTGGPSSDDRVYTAFAPSIVTFGGHGRLVSISSPLGEAGKLYDMYRKGVEEDNKTFMCFQLPSWLANPTIKMSVLEEMEAADPDNFWAEYGASFLASTSRSYIQNIEALKDCVDKGRHYDIIRPSTGLRYYMAIDIGFVRDGFAAAIVHAEGTRIIVDYANIFFAKQAPYEHLDMLEPEDMADYVFSIYSQFRPSAACMDQFESFSFNSLLSRKGVKIERVTFDRSTNSEAYQSFRNRIYQGDIRLPDYSYLQKELRNLRVTSSSKYSLKVEAPFGAHDDLSDAVVRACWLCEREHFNPRERSKRAKSISMSMTRGSGVNPRTAAFSKQAQKIRRGLNR